MLESFKSHEKAETRSRKEWESHQNVAVLPLCQPKLVTTLLSRVRWRYQLWLLHLVQDLWAHFVGFHIQI